MLLLTVTLYAQYAVTGGSVPPLLALDDTPNRLQVYLVYGTEDVKLQYTSASTSHRWYRYKTKALEAESIAATQEGTTSSLSPVEEGYGYFVEEEGVLSRYVWIIDYSQYAFDIQSLTVTDTDNPCDELWLDGKAVMPPLTYYVPNGLQRELERSFEVVYNTLEYAAANKNFVQKPLSITLTGNPFRSPLPPPLCDTEISLKGDLFARHFKIEKSISTPTYQAVAIEAHLDTTTLSFGAPNMIGAGGAGFSAPIDVHFEAIANEPAAVFYKWTLAHDKAGKVDTVLSFTARSMDYTFKDEGRFTAILEVGDRTGKCRQTDSVSMEIGGMELSVPNAFSPGASPGVNDEFRVAYKSLVSFKAWIFDRWGAEMFYWTDPAKGWDGKKGGKYVAPGVYFYVIEAKGSDGKNHIRKGHINIIRPKNAQDRIIE
ncbi:MAG: gliding motility-associated C-terminal domain-containing protein [Tannerellaceae bacterium]|nr:gliding motility-associated C-terminal domain-containing protein [Tannerellaceae bacterium]